MTPVTELKSSGRLRMAVHVAMASPAAPSSAAPSRRGFHFLLMAYRPPSRQALPIDIRVVHLFGPDGRGAEFPFGHGLSAIAQVIVARGQVIGIEAGRIMQQLAMIERPQLDTVFTPV